MNAIVSSRFPTALTILPTYKCTAACQNCCFHCSPKIEGRIPQERIIQYIIDATRIPSIKLVVFSGGECFLLNKDLEDTVSTASKLGLKTRCVTNAYWANSSNSTRNRLKPLVAAGLDELNISTGDFHQEWIPIENVVRAVVEGTSLGITVVIMIEARNNRNYTFQKLINDPSILRILNDSKLKNLFSVVESPWISSDIIQTFEHKRSSLISANNIFFNLGCSSVLSTIVISPSEHVGACCGLTYEQIPEMRLGSLRENSLVELVKFAKTDFLKIWLMIEGPYGVLKWASEKDKRIKWENRFVHQCDACRFLYSDSAVRKVIRERYQEKVADILFRFSLFDCFGLEEPK